MSTRGQEGYLVEKISLEQSAKELRVGWTPDRASFTDAFGTTPPGSVQQNGSHPDQASLQNVFRKRFAEDLKKMFKKTFKASSQPRR